MAQLHLVMATASALSLLGCSARDVEVSFAGAGGTASSSRSGTTGAGTVGADRDGGSGGLVDAVATSGGSGGTAGSGATGGAGRLGGTGGLTGVGGASGGTGGTSAVSCSPSINSIEGCALSNDALLAVSASATVMVVGVEDTNLECGSNLDRS